MRSTPLNPPPSRCAYSLPFSTIFAAPTDLFRWIQKRSRPNELTRPETIDDIPLSNWSRGRGLLYHIDIILRPITFLRLILACPCTYLCTSSYTLKIQLFYLPDDLVQDMKLELSDKSIVMSFKMIVAHFIYSMNLMPFNGHINRSMWIKTSCFSNYRYGFPTEWLTKASPADYEASYESSKRLFHCTNRVKSSLLLTASYHRLPEVSCS